MNPVMIKFRKWHVANAFGWRGGLFEADTLCGRHQRGGGYIGYPPYPNPKCQVCVKRAVSYGWLKNEDPGLPASPK